MAFVFLIYIPLMVAAWVKVGPIAGLAATGWLAFMLFIASRPGTTLWGPGKWTPTSRPSSGAASGPTDMPDDSSGERQRRS